MKLSAIPGCGALFPIAISTLQGTILDAKNRVGLVPRPAEGFNYRNSV
jgi:hypothetical protein